jgi:flagellar biosynthesis/type III secretory pathway M-ring protein FliF/YscJ
VGGQITAMYPEKDIFDVAGFTAVRGRVLVEELKKQNIPYDLSQDQRTVQVPASRVGELRLKFAGDGLPKGEGIGFEKLESPSLTTTDFTQSHPITDVIFGYAEPSTVCP